MSTPPSKNPREPNKYVNSPVSSLKLNATPAARALGASARLSSKMMAYLMRAPSSYVFTERGQVADDRTAGLWSIVQLAKHASQYDH